MRTHEMAGTETVRAVDWIIRGGRGQGQDPQGKGGLSRWRGGSAAGGGNSRRCHQGGDKQKVKQAAEQQEKGDRG